MLAWRISRSLYAQSALTGFGAAQRGGRWNSRGIPVVYASSSRALALLEVLAHIDREQTPSDLVYTRLAIPDDAMTTVESLPASWNAEPPRVETRTIGDPWIREPRSLGLLVPSAIVPDEWNVLVNPAHQRFGEIIIRSDGLATIDRRLIEG